MGKELHGQHRRDIFSDDRRILETWLVNGRFPLQFVATGTEEVRRPRAKKGLPIKPRFLVKKAGVLRASGSGCCISAFANAPHPTPPNYSSIGF